MMQSFFLVLMVASSDTGHSSVAVVPMTYSSRERCEKAGQEFVAGDRCRSFACVPSGNMP